MCGDTIFWCVLVSVCDVVIEFNGILVSCSINMIDDLLFGLIL